MFLYVRFVSFLKLLEIHYRARETGNYKTRTYDVIAILQSKRILYNCVIRTNKIIYL